MRCVSALPVDEAGGHDKRTTRISGGGGGGGGGDGEVKRAEAPPAHRLPHPSSQPSLDDPEEKLETGCLRRSNQKRLVITPSSSACRWLLQVQKENKQVNCLYTRLALAVVQTREKQNSSCVLTCEWFHII